MIHKTLIKLFIFISIIMFINCRINNRGNTSVSPQVYDIQPNNCTVKIDLRTGNKGELKSFLLEDSQQNFSFVLNLIDDGNCMYKIVTKIYEETTNTYILENSDKLMEKCIVINNKLYRIEEIHADGSITSENKIE
ncbi:hypothetical protein [uncultured Treponema sp.]|uniref:hypothetical protein n=1 Tax=uncultured Treponema sp. TaxID=162155 RepID=UPI0028E22EF4|nr:hypothetical protein [uncultured Treponema sp.]